MRKRSPKLTVVGPDATGSSPPPKPPSRGAKLLEAILADVDVGEAGARENLEQICKAVDRLDEISACIEAAGSSFIVKGQRGLRMNPLLRLEASLRIFVVRELTRLGLEPVQGMGRPANGFVGVGPLEDDDDDDDDDDDEE